MSNEPSATNRRGVSDLISGRLADLGESQKWLAQRAGMSESSLSDILAMKQDITVQQANRLAKVSELGLTATVILATAANADLTDEQRLIKGMGLVGALYARLSPSKKEQVQDLITLLYQKESSRNEPDRNEESPPAESKKPGAGKRK